MLASPSVTDPSRLLSRLAVRAGERVPGERVLAEECAVAFSYNRLSHAVMMATPDDLEDLALGFSLNEAILDEVTQLHDFQVVAPPGEDVGLELRMWIDEARMGQLEKRRRRMAGPTGCGLCGLESLSDAVQLPAQVPDGPGFTAKQVAEAMASLAPAQTLNHATRAVHAAGFWTPTLGLVAVREDVGRHNALDKLAGALARQGMSVDQGIVALTSRLSVELVQKAARMGAPVLAAISAPTALAVRVAERCGMTLIGVARADGYEVFSGARRVI